MNYKLFALVALFLLTCSDLLAQAGSGVYVGGHIRRERPSTVTKLKESGFTYVILFNVSVEEDGTLTTDGETICKNGQYVFADEQPYYIEDVKALKTWPTSIERIEICIGGWGNESYSRIRSLIEKSGTGSNSILYRNFQALKQAIPEIDAVNNDDEHCYHAESAVQFHTMMYDLGYKTTIAPYTYKNFWQSLVSGLNANRSNACDRVLIQCYDGGANNNPSDWHLGNLSVHAGRTNYQTDMATSVAQMQTWRDNNGVVGGFVWVYNDETWNLNQWAAAMNRVFPTKQVDEPAVTLYTGSSFGGDAIALPVGRFSKGELAVYGLADKTIQSLKINSGYKLTAYVSTDLSGSTMKVWNGGEEPERLGAWSRRISSLEIEMEETDGIETLHDSTVLPSDEYYDLQGRKLSNGKSSNSQMKKGLYIKNGKKIVINTLNRSLW